MNRGLLIIQDDKTTFVLDKAMEATDYKVTPSTILMLTCLYILGHIGSVYICVNSSYVKDVVNLWSGLFGVVD